jgi:hypothetical protein
MQAIEYRTVDKSSWARGPWDSEPDKRQWRDDETGLPCLIVRNHSGAWCGYVGIGEGHPFYGKSYGDRIPVPDRDAVAISEKTSPIALFCEALREDDGCVSLDMVCDVHGGITFADHCHEAGRAEFDCWREMMLGCKGEIDRFPRGDSAERWREMGHLLDDFDGWRTHCEQTSICHRVEAGENDKVWWLGFDCCHCGDASPRYIGELRGLGSGVYRDVNYVTTEVGNLARQLAGQAVVPA